MRAYTAPRDQDLARAVIHQAILDSDINRMGKNNSKADYASAIEFLSNSRELEFYAMLAECEDEMVRAGYLMIS